jgi:hypothetical protein
MSGHSLRAHSRFSASGSERWLNCAASVELEKDCPNVSSSFADEGTKAHEILERFLLSDNWPALIREYEMDFLTPPEMLTYVLMSAKKIKALAQGKLLLVEKKIFNTFIHEDMFGTCDVIIPDHGKKLHIIDFKYGMGHVVKPQQNTQLIQYALGAAESYDWKFSKVEMSIIQPRVGKNWFSTWVIDMTELKTRWLPLWHKGVARVEKGNNKPFAGHWCQWCKAKQKCPVKNAVREMEISNAFILQDLKGG